MILAIIALTFFPRILSLQSHWATDESLWMMRSRNFALSIIGGDVSGTVQSYHPGVTVMWLGGIALFSKYRYALDIALPYALNPFLSQENLVITRKNVAIVIAAIIILAFYLLWKSLGLNIAVVGTIFMALDPFYLALSRQLHNDALMAAFLTVTILMLLIYMEYSKKRYLILSGVCFGLACLTKSSALILVPYFPLLSFLYRLFQHKEDRTTKNIYVTCVVCAFLVWIGTACLVFIALWPIFWGMKINIANLTIPCFGFLALTLLGIIYLNYRQLKSYSDENRYEREVLSKLIPKLALLVGGISLCVLFSLVKARPFWYGIFSSLITPHEVAHKFLGRTVYDPGPFFYFVIISLRCAPMILFFFIFGTTKFTLRQGFQYNDKMRRIFLSLLMFIVLFIIVISTGAKKLDRYLLPVFPILDILAAIGLWSFLNTVLKYKNGYLANFGGKLQNWHRNRPHVLSYLIVIPVTLFYIMSSLTMHPYYGLFYSPLWPKSMLTEMFDVGGGLDKAAAYLNEKKDSEELIVYSYDSHAASNFGYYFKGRVITDMDTFRLYADYEIISSREMNASLGKEYHKNHSLDHVIRINNIDLVWIYRTTEKGI